MKLREIHRATHPARWDGAPAEASEPERLRARRLPATALEWLGAELDDAGSAFELVALTCEVADAIAGIAREAVPDMPDGIIAATAHRMGLPLVTSDHKIRASGIAVIW